MIGGAGNLPSKMARTKSRPDIDAITCVGVTPYSTFGVAVLSSMEYSCCYNYDHHTKGISPNRCVRHMISHHAPDLVRSCVESWRSHGAARWRDPLARNGGGERL